MIKGNFSNHKKLTATKIDRACVQKILQWNSRLCLLIPVTGYTSLIVCTQNKIKEIVDAQLTARIAHPQRSLISRSQDLSETPRIPENPGP